MYSIITYDSAWENRAYMHIKFDHFLDFETSLLIPKQSLSMKLVQKEMRNIMQFTELVYRRWDKWNNVKRYILCTYKPYFLMPGHILCEHNNCMNIYTHINIIHSSVSYFSIQWWSWSDPVLNLHLTWCQCKWYLYRLAFAAWS